MLEYHLNASGCWVAWQAGWLALVADPESPSWSLCCFLPLCLPPLWSCSVVFFLNLYILCVSVLLLTFFYPSFFKWHFVCVCLLVFPPSPRWDVLKKQCWDVEINMRVPALSLSQRVIEQFSEDKDNMTKCERENIFRENDRSQWIWIMAQRISHFLFNSNNFVLSKGRSCAEWAKLIS